MIISLFKNIFTRLFKRKIHPKSEMSKMMELFSRTKAQKYAEISREEAETRKIVLKYLKGK